MAESTQSERPRATDDVLRVENLAKKIFAVNMIQDGEITFDKPTADASVEELNEIVVEEYRRARLAAVGQGDNAGP